MKNWWLYVLKLEQGKYYVGVTSQDDPQVRIRQHGRFASAAWTRKYKPVETLELYEIGKMSYEQAQVIENKKTRELIKEFGLDNVRGGDLTYINKYYQSFGRVFTNDNWETITITIFLSLGILLMAILYILK